MRVQIWSDVVCPWCYLGKRRFEAALARFNDVDREHRDDVEVEWKAFELDPSAVSAPPGEVPPAGSHAAALASKFAIPLAQAQQMLDSMAATAAAEGLSFRFDRVVAANTVDAHQVVHLAGMRGVQDAVKERLMRAYFTEGAAVGDRDTLVSLAVEAGLDCSEVARVLDEGTYLGEVRADEDEARSLGITGVPFFVVDGRYGVSGAQPADHLLAVLERAWSERAPVDVEAGAASGACGPDGCVSQGPAIVGSPA